ncbi:MAG: hypothetical protein J6V25_09370 [Oscillospiraceae bacterium]|nr:hypothetical protein [Oscillospiraceae bacterium]
MTQKPKIQYIGQFYVHGSEARALELEQPRKPKTKLPLAKLEQVEKIHVDPVALVAIAVAMVMMVTMILGVQQLYTDWQEYRAQAQHVHELREINHTKQDEFRSTYDLDDIRAKATALGMIPKEEAQHMTVTVTLPEPAEEMSWWDNVVWFVTGLFA